MRCLRCFLAFALGLALTAIVLYRVVPGDQAIIAEALTQADRCEVLVVGPSYIKVGIDTDVVEQETARLGEPLKVCKFARTALRGYELRHELETLLSQRWPKLKRVLVDISLGNASLGFERENYFNPRTVHWHTFRAVPALWRFYEQKRLPWLEKAPLLWAHALHLARNYLGIGRGASALLRARVVEQLRGAPPPPPVSDDVDRMPVAQKEATPRDYVTVRSQIIAAKKRFRKQGKEGSDAWFRELERVIRARGYSPVFVRSPVLASSPPPPRLSRPKKAKLVYLDFEDPERFPELYEPAARGHTSHVSPLGAVAYSKALARELVALEAPP